MCVCSLSQSVASQTLWVLKHVFVMYFDRLTSKQIYGRRLLVFKSEPLLILPVVEQHFVIRFLNTDMMLVLLSEHNCMWNIQGCNVCVTQYKLLSVIKCQCYSKSKSGSRVCVTVMQKHTNLDYHHFPYEKMREVHTRLPSLVRSFSFSH